MKKFKEKTANIPIMRFLIIIVVSVIYIIIEQIYYLTHDALFYDPAVFEMCIIIFPLVWLMFACAVKHPVQKVKEIFSTFKTVSVIKKIKYSFCLLVLAATFIIPLISLDAGISVTEDSISRKAPLGTNDRFYSYSDIVQVDCEVEYSNLTYSFAGEHLLYTIRFKDGSQLGLYDLYGNYFGFKNNESMIKFDKLIADKRFIIKSENAVRDLKIVFRNDDKSLEYYRNIFGE